MVKEDPPPHESLHMVVRIKMRRQAARRTTALLFAVTILSCVGLPDDDGAGSRPAGRCCPPVTPTATSASLIFPVEAPHANSNSCRDGDARRHVRRSVARATATGDRRRLRAGGTLDELQRHAARLRNLRPSNLAA